MSPQEVIAKMNLRFQSGNSVPVDSSRITKEEWEVVKSILKDENDGLVKQETNKQLREERDALAAHVVRMQGALELARDRIALLAKIATDRGAAVYAALDMWPEEMEQVLAETPETSLKRMKAKWQAEAVSDFAFHHLGSLDQESAEIYASKLRRQAEDKSP